MNLEEKDKNDKHIGERYGRLVIIGVDRRQKHKRYRCLCDCGRVTYQRINVLRNKSVVSCGCYHREMAANEKFKHGYARERLYKVWSGMKQRCDNPNHKAYGQYGGRGIRVCEEWSKNYVSFREFMLTHGYDPEAPFGECTIDRIDNDGDYCPENCRVVSVQEQQVNKGDVFSFILDGKRTTISGASRSKGISRSGIQWRMRKGMTLNEAINRPLREVRTYEAEGQVHTLKEWAEIMRVTQNVIYGRLITHSFEEIYNDWKEKGNLEVKKVGVKLYTVGKETHNQTEWSKILGIPNSTLRNWLKKKTMEQIVYEIHNKDKE